MKQIQIMEDDAAIRTELETLLRANGYMPVEDGPADLILMDVNLPGESGYTRCRKLRETSNTPVIFLTARDTLEDELLAFGVVFGKVYEIWNLTGLSGGKAMETAVVISLAVAGIYALYFLLTWRIACGHVVCRGGER